MHDPRFFLEASRQGVFQATVLEPDPAGADAPAGNTAHSKTIAVCSGKGGVGKTMFSLSLAIALARMKKRVLLIDADFGLANVHLQLGMLPRKNLCDVIDGGCTPGEVIENGPGGIHVMPGAAGIERMANLTAKEIAVLYARLSEIDRAYDFTIIDTAAGIGAPVTGIARFADMPLVVVTPEPTSLADAYSMIKALHRQGARQIGVVANMAATEREAVETFDRLNTLVVKFLKLRLHWYGSLPFERDVARSVRKQQPLIVANPLGQFSNRLQKTAWKICGVPGQRGGGFFGRLLRRSAGAQTVDREAEGTLP